MAVTKQPTLSQRVLERTPVDAAALAIIEAAGFALDPGDPKCADKYDAMQKAALLYAATVMREANRTKPVAAEWPEFDVLDGESALWAKAWLVEVHGDTARWEEQVSDCARLLTIEASRVFEVAKKKQDGAK